MNTNYRLLKVGEKIEAGDESYFPQTNTWGKVNAVWNRVVDIATPVRRAIWSYDEMPEPQHKIQVTALQLGLIHELVDIKYHELEFSCKHHDEYADILLRLDDSEEVI